METLDGNAIAGSLFEYFGSEMTSVRGQCRHCGTFAPIAELAVYARAPGAVARCRTCGDVAFVLVKARGSIALHAEAFQLPQAVSRNTRVRHGPAFLGVYPKCR